MFTMEEVGSVRKGDRPQKSISFGDTNASDDEDEDFYMCSITDDPISPTKEICDYLKNLVQNKQLSNSLPKNAFAYRVRKHAFFLTHPMDLALLWPLAMWLKYLVPCSILYYATQNFVQCTLQLSTASFVIFSKPCHFQSGCLLYFLQKYRIVNCSVLALMKQCYQKAIA